MTYLERRTCAHSTAQQSTRAHHSTTQLRWCAIARRPRSTAAHDIGAQPRAGRSSRHAQTGRRQHPFVRPPATCTRAAGCSGRALWANKGGPRLLSFILAPPGVATSSSFSSRTPHVLRNTRNSVDPARLSHGSVTSASRHAGANDSRCAVWVGSASAGFCHSAISSHSTRESSSCTPSM